MIRNGVGFGLLWDGNNTTRNGNNRELERKGIGRIWAQNREGLRRCRVWYEGYRRNNMEDDKYGKNYSKQNELCPQAVIMNKKKRFIYRRRE